MYIHYASVNCVGKRVGRTWLSYFTFFFFFFFFHLTSLFLLMHIHRCMDPQVVAKLNSQFALKTINSVQRTSGMGYQCILVLCTFFMFNEH